MQFNYWLIAELTFQIGTYTNDVSLLNKKKVISGQNRGRSTSGSIDDKCRQCQTSKNHIQKHLIRFAEPSGMSSRGRTFQILKIPYF